MFNSIPTFVINLPFRTDRRRHIVNEFAKYPEFDVRIFEAVCETPGSYGLWLSILEIVKVADENKMEYVLICEDDHVFTDAFSLDKYFNDIRTAGSAGASLLHGGISSAEEFNFFISRSLCNVQAFTGTQFMLIFQNFFKAILDAKFDKNRDSADLILSHLSSNSLVCQPFISTQCEFGYSDVTHYYNNRPGYVERLFKITEEKLRRTRLIQQHYISSLECKPFSSCDFYDFRVPVFYMKQCCNSLVIEDELKRKYEFEFSIMNVPEKLDDAILLKFVKKAIKIAIERDDEIIMICTQDYRFAPGYSREKLVEAVATCFVRNADILVFSTSEFNYTMPVGSNVFWIDSFWNSGCFVFYKDFFGKLLELDLDPDQKLDDGLSNLTPNKFVLFPFIFEDMKTEHDKRHLLVTNRYSGGIESAKRRLRYAQNKFELIKSVI